MKDHRCGRPTYAVKQRQDFDLRLLIWRLQRETGDCVDELAIVCFRFAQCCEGISIEQPAVTAPRSSTRNLQFAASF